MRIIPNVILLSVIICLAFILYVLPFTMAGYLLQDTPLISYQAVIATFIIAVILIIYMRTHVTAKVLSNFTYYGMGIGFTCLWIFGAAYLLASIAPDFKRHFGIVALITSLSLVAYSLINARRLVIRPLPIASSKLTSETSFIFISDVHLGSNKASHLEAIIDKITGLNFDFLVIGGDLFDSSAFVPSQLAPLRQINKPVYFITGNHEYYVKNHADKLTSLADYNITSLDNEAIAHEHINIIGISDNQPIATQAEFAKKLISDSAFNLLLVHQPGLWGTHPAGTDLMLSGHTHNGQIFPFNYLVKLQFKANYGHYQQGNSQLYVSSGAGCWGPKMRLGSRNEIIHITLSQK